MTTVAAQASSTKHAAGELRHRLVAFTLFFPPSSSSLQAIVNPDWQDMIILAQSDRDGRSQGLQAVYRKRQEGERDPKQRPITAHVEADRQHIENIVNFCCSFLWASILDSAPPPPHLTLL